MDEDLAQVIAELQTVQLSLHEIRTHAEAMLARCESLKSRIESLRERCQYRALQTFTYRPQ